MKKKSFLINRSTLGSSMCQSRGTCCPLPSLLLP